MPIALLTDFGTKDYFVGAMKGVILSIDPHAAIVDITHEVEPHDIRSAAFLLASCCRDFPPATVFCCVVDPGVGSDRRAIVAEFGDRYFVAPDNGLISIAINEPEKARVHEIQNPNLIRPETSTTFHGRDIFAPAAAHLSRGVKASELGPKMDSFVRFNGLGIVKTETGLEGEIIHIDRFGNLITNFRSEIATDTIAVVVAGRKIDRVATHYADIERGELALIPGSAGFIEISANMSSAADILNVKPGQKVRLDA